jgi:hypothetical protein
MVLKAVGVGLKPSLKIRFSDLIGEIKGVDNV